MINFFIELTVWKRSATFRVYPLLSLAWCLMIMLGVVLVTNQSYAQQPCEITVYPGSPVVVQNVGKQNDARGGLSIRENPKAEGNNDLKVYDGSKGTVMRDWENDDKYFEIEMDGKLVKHVWYYVKWDNSPAGWSAGIIEGKKHIATILEADQKDVIVEALFNGKNRDKTSGNYIHHYQTKHDYNDYQCNANWGPYKEGGHAGWDVRTKDELPADQPFFSLTEGTVRFYSDCNVIAVYDGEMTTLYLHAKTVVEGIKTGETKMVSVGQRLGIQGKKCIDILTKPHVHIEVHKGEVYGAVPSANDTTTNPIPYLYESVTRARTEFHPFDVNRDGQVNLLDALEVLLNWGTNNKQCDINNDGVVTLEDCDEIDAYLNDSPVLRVRSAESSLDGNTLLLTNFPNPFNPETWIPYQLARSTEVSISIHAAGGALVRTLDLGHQPAGLYLQRSRAAYWDGRNAMGETVASGVYFYTLSAGDFTATRRMLIGR